MSQEEWWSESKLMPAGIRIADWINDMFETGAEYIDLEDLSPDNGP